MLKRPCARCGVPSRQTPCASCRAAAPRRPHRRTDTRPPRQRGYDALYEVNRATLVSMVRMYDLPCALCGGSFAPGQAITADHVVPLRRGGGNDLDNLRPAHVGCNSGWRRRSRAYTAPGATLTA